MAPRADRILLSPRSLRLHDSLNPTGEVRFRSLRCSLVSCLIEVLLGTFVPLVDKLAPTVAITGVAPSPDVGSNRDATKKHALRGYLMIEKSLIAFLLVSGIDSVSSQRLP